MSHFDSNQTIYKPRQPKQSKQTKPIYDNVMNNDSSDNSKLAKILLQTKSSSPLNDIHVYHDHSISFMCCKENNHYTLYFVFNDEIVHTVRLQNDQNELLIPSKISSIPNFVSTKIINSENYSIETMKTYECADTFSVKINTHARKDYKGFKSMFASVNKNKKVIKIEIIQNSSSILLFSIIVDGNGKYIGSIDQ